MGDQDFTINIPAAALGLSDIAVESAELTKKEMFIYVTSTCDDILCRQCGHPMSPYGRELTLCH